MSCSLDIFLNYPSEKNFVNRLRAELGVDVADSSCDTHSIEGEFRLSATQFWLSQNEVDLQGGGISDDVYLIHIESVVPHPRELDAFSLVWGVLIKTLHIDLVIAESLLVFSVQSSIARLLNTEAEGDLVNGLNDERFAFSELPSKLKIWLSTHLAALHR